MILVLAAAFILTGWLLADLPIVGSLFYVLSLLAFWLAERFVSIDTGGPLLAPRASIALALAQLVGFAVLLSRLAGAS